MKEQKLLQVKKNSKQFVFILLIRPTVICKLILMFRKEQQSSKKNHFYEIKKLPSLMVYILT